MSLRNPLRRPASAQAAALIDIGRLAEAEALLGAAIAQGSQDPSDYALLSVCLLRQGRSEEAVVAGRAAVTHGPDVAHAHTALARALLGHGRDREALEVAKVAVRLAPSSRDAVAALAETAMDVDLPLAEKAAVALQRLAPVQSIGHHLRARVEMNRGRWEEAERWLREALRRDPLSRADHANLALALDRQGRRAEAAEAHEAALRLDPQAVIARQNLHISLRAGEHRGEAPAADRPDADLVASTLPPAVLARSLTNVILDALRSGRMDAARSAAEQAQGILDSLPLDTVEERRTRILVTDAIAMVDARRGREPAVVERLSAFEAEAVEVLRPRELIVFLNNLGIARLRTADPAAVATLTAVAGLARDAGNADRLGMALLNLGAAHANEGADDSAARCYRECLDLARANGHARRAATASLNLGRVALRQGQLDEAARILDGAITALAGLDQPMLHAQARIAAGGVALRRGDLGAARRTVLTALWVLHRGGDQRSVDGPSFLAEIAAANGRHTVAAIHLRTAERRARTTETRATAARARAAVEAAARRSSST